MRQPTITCPMGFALLIDALVSVCWLTSGEQPTTVNRIWMAFNMYGGTLNIIASLKIGQLSARFRLVFFFDTFFSFFCKYTCNDVAFDFYSYLEWHTHHYVWVRVAVIYLNENILRHFIGIVFVELKFSGFHNDNRQTFCRGQIAD